MADIELIVNLGPGNKDEGCPFNYYCPDGEDSGCMLQRRHTKRERELVVVLDRRRR